MRRSLWCDAEANCHRMADRAGVRDIVEKAVRANIDTLIVDVKPLGGEVLYNSKFAPRLGTVNGFKYPESFDLLDAMIEECRPQGLKIHAAVNVFSEGHREWGRGPAYEHPEWQIILHEAIRTLTFSGDRSIKVEIVDPWNPSDAPVIYTRRSGKTHKPGEGRQCVEIEGDRVSSITSGMEVSIAEDGCILSIPDSLANGIQAGDEVHFHAEPVFRPSGESMVTSWGIFVDPTGPARAHELRIIEEIAANYDVDCITLDRMRYPNLYGGFSEDNRSAFEKWFGRGAVEWPGDVYTIDVKPWNPPIQGRYYREWIEWRAWQILGFAQEAVDLARATRKGVDVGIYVGSWYDSYFDVGVNWGSREFHAGYDWMTPGYNRTGYAELFDYLCTGCYYPTVTREDAREKGVAEGATVEAACELSRRAIREASPTYGSLYLKDYKGASDEFRRAIDVCERITDGVMFFDLVYLYEYGWWPILEDAFR